MSQKEVTKTFIELMREGRALTDPIRLTLYREWNYSKPSTCALGAACYAYAPVQIRRRSAHEVLDELQDLFDLKQSVTFDPTAVPGLADELVRYHAWTPGRPYNVPISVLIMHLNDVGMLSTEEIIALLIKHQVPAIQTPRTFIQEVPEEPEVIA
jgi:hypothetical protein